MDRVYTPGRPFFVRASHFRSFFIGLLVFLLVTVALFQNGGRVVRADTSIGNVPAGTTPQAVAVNPVTNKIYIANSDSNNVTVIDGSNNSTTTVAAGTNPFAIAVNSFTNKVYITNQISGNVTVIDGTDNTVAATVTAGLFPAGLAVNPLTNKIYVVNNGDSTVTVIDGATNLVEDTVPVGTNPFFVAVNPVTNKIYVPGSASNDVTVIDGTNNSTTSVATAFGPFALAVNPATNKIYVANNGNNNVTVIDGSDNSTATVTAGSNPLAVAVNPVTNKIYIANNNNSVSVIDGNNNATTPVTVGTTPSSVALNPVTNMIYVSNISGNNVTVIDGTNNSTTTVAAGSNPKFVGVNPVTNRIYVANQSSSNVTVIDGSSNTSTPVATGNSPFLAAVNPATNKIYVASDGPAVRMTVIDGVNNSTVTIGINSMPSAIAVNPITNKIYLGHHSAVVTVIDGNNNSAISVPTTSSTGGIAINPVTNKIYMTGSSSSVNVMDGATNTFTSIPIAPNSFPIAFAVNPVTNRIYVANDNNNTVSVINGANNAVTTVGGGLGPSDIGVNPVTNKIYVAARGANKVTVIDGVNNSIIANIPTIPTPFDLDIDPITNKIYVVGGGDLVTVIDGSNNTTTAVSTGSYPFAVAVNQATNKIYVANCGSTGFCGGTGIGDVTIIDGTTNSTATVLAGINPYHVAVNPVSNKAYVTNRATGNASVIVPAPTNALPLNTIVTPFVGNTTTSATPTLNFVATSTYSPTAPPPQNIYFQVDTANGTWTKATNTGSTSTTLSAIATPGGLYNGIHIIYFFATDGSDATSINPRPSELWGGWYNDPPGAIAPESSPVTGGINAYLFLVAAGLTPTPTATPTQTGSPTPTGTATPTNTPTATPSTVTAISGTVTYGNAVSGPTPPRFVSNVQISGAGSPSISATTSFPGGMYLLSGFGAGPYTVTPSKTGGVNGITSFDAARIAQHVAGVNPLTGNQLAVADVSGNGSVSSFDAGQVAGFVVSSPPFGSTGEWRFSPVDRVYPSVDSILAGQDFSALLMGEVSGNWSNTGARPVDSRHPQLTVAGDDIAGSGDEPENNIAVTAPRLATPDTEIIVPVTVGRVANKGIISYEFDLRYDPSVIELLPDPVDLMGTVSSKLSVSVNADETGLLKVAVYGPMPIKENGVLMNLRFMAVGKSGSISPLTWERIVFNEGDPATTAIGGEVGLSSATPNQGEITGRLLMAMGRGATHARVTLTDTTGQSRSTLSNEFGVYRFVALQVGQTYAISVDAKRCTFAPLTVTVTDQFVSVDMIAGQ